MTLGNIVILTILFSTARAQKMALYLCFFFLFLSPMFSARKSFAFSFKFIHKFFILFDFIENGILSFIYYSLFA